MNKRNATLVKNIREGLKVLSRPLALIIFTLVILSVSFNNCSRVGLQGMPLHSVLSVGSGQLDMQSSSFQSTLRRYSFLVDMSHSMIKGPCAYDADQNRIPATEFFDKECLPSSARFTITGNSGVGMTTYPGADVKGVRLQMVRRWLEDLERTSTPEALADTKILLVPFSGGQKDVDRDVRIKELSGKSEKEWTKFLSVADAKVYLSYLKAIHDAEVVLSGKDWQKFLMGTSVPGIGIDKIFTLISEEMKNLQVTGQLHSAIFALVMFSDGVATPIRQYIENTFQRFNIYASRNGWGTKNCTSGDLAARPAQGADPRDADCVKLGEDMRLSWGPHEINEPSVIVDGLRRFHGLNRLYPEAQIQILGVMPPEDNVPASSRTESVNWLLSLASKSNEADFNMYSLKTLDKNFDPSDPSQDMPFDLPGASSGLVSYKMTNLYVINLNARFNSTGQLVADSDGDGLSDEDEARFGTDPHSIRTDGVCLDKISVQPAYHSACQAAKSALECDPTVDIDGDGLNECEEKILGTSDLDFDTDGDSVPDSLEVLFDLQPLVDDSQNDANSDGVSNLSQFAMGLPSWVSPARVQNNLKIEFFSDFKGFVLNQSGASLTQFEKFVVHLRSAPLIGTSGASDQGAMYFSKRKNKANEIPASHRLLGGGIEPGKNKLLFIARGIQSDQPDRAFWSISTEVYEAPMGHGELVMQGHDVDLSKIQRIRALDFNKP